MNQAGGNGKMKLQMTEKHVEIANELKKRLPSGWTYNGQDGFDYNINEYPFSIRFSIKNGNVYYIIHSSPYRKLESFIEEVKFWIKHCTGRHTTSNKELVTL